MPNHGLMIMRYAIFLLLLSLLTLVLIQLRWGEDSSHASAQSMTLELEQAKIENNRIRLINMELNAELKDLRENTEILEDHARNELGMVKPDEVLIVLR